MSAQDAKMITGQYAWPAPNTLSKYNENFDFNVGLGWHRCELCPKRDNQCDVVFLEIDYKTKVSSDWKLRQTGEKYQRIMSCDFIGQKVINRFNHRDTLAVCVYCLNNKILAPELVFIRLKTFELIQDLGLYSEYDIPAYLRSKPMRSAVVRELKKSEFMLELKEAADLAPESTDGRALREHFQSLAGEQEVKLLENLPTPEVSDALEEKAQKESEEMLALFQRDMDEFFNKAWASKRECTSKSESPSQQSHQGLECYLPTPGPFVE